MTLLINREINIVTVIFAISCVFQKAASKNIDFTNIDEHRSLENLNYFYAPNGTEGNASVYTENIRTVAQSNETKSNNVTREIAGKVTNISTIESPGKKISNISLLLMNSSSNSMKETNSSNLGSQAMNSSNDSVEEANRFSNLSSQVNTSLGEANRFSNFSSLMRNHSSSPSEKTGNTFKNVTIQVGNSTYMKESAENNSKIEDSMLITSNFSLQNENISQNFSQMIQNTLSIANVFNNESIQLTNASSHESEDVKLHLEAIFNDNFNMKVENVSSDTSVEIQINMTNNSNIEIAEEAMRMRAKIIMNDEEVIEFLIKQDMDPLKCWTTSHHNITTLEELNEGNDTEKHVKYYLKILNESPYTSMDWKTLAKLGRAKKFMQDRYWHGGIVPYYLRGLSKKYWRKRYPLMGFLGLKREFAASRNYNELQYYWTKWNDITGKSMRKKFLTYIYINKINSKMSGQKSVFIKEQDHLRVKIDSLYQEILPLYRRFHSYVRKRLLKKYGYRRIHRSGPIPAHLLGDISSHDWTNIESLLRPYPNKTALEICKNIKERNISAESIAEIAEDFYASLGFNKLDKKFWDNSVFETLSINCTNSLSVKCDNESIGLHACYDPDCYYFAMFHWATSAHQLKHNITVSPAISEALSNAIILSTTMPEFLFSSGLSSIMIYDREDEINFLMETALRIIPSMMDSLSVGLWKRITVEEIKFNRRMNENFWKHRLYYQGLCPPVVRSERDFDAGAINSIANDLNTMKDFLSGFLQFQIYKSLCNASGHRDALHRCNLLNSIEAGRRIRKLLFLGKPVTITDALSVLTDGNEEITSGPLIEYFKPLYEWFLKQEEFDEIGWESYDATVCPKCAF
ncbi:angiotensin-converting enzyme-like [Centruroides vittatus]|uniref:angiotensin-converting enzyme-like n=1 Tax=Centruroides vittatus TaxID=120091 RepID=UPI00350F3ECF